MSVKGGLLSKEAVVQLCGDVPDWKIARILALEPTYEELEAAILWSEGAEDAMAEARKTLAGRTAAIYEIIIADEDLWDEQRGP
jgi:hypothetical protein